MSSKFTYFPVASQHPPIALEWWVGKIQCINEGNNAHHKKIHMSILHINAFFCLHMQFTLWKQLSNSILWMSRPGWGGLSKTCFFLFFLFFMNLKGANHILKIWVFAKIKVKAIFIYNQSYWFMEYIFQKWSCCSPVNMVNLTISFSIPSLQYENEGGASRTAAGGHDIEREEGKADMHP